ncbi:type II toxin-antitoxin system RelE/ParE family toxin [Patescibacteria group bacterium]|nr:type II toxin-antitoxin system RelE/ParE family toxin [Patescibacteria group bacterium]
MPPNFNIEILPDVTEFLDKCNEKLRVKILRKLQYVNEFGLTSAVPSLKKVIKTNFWELRILGKDNVRLFCIRNKNTIWIIHAFFKKTQKTKRREINIAKKRFHSLDL